MANRQGTRKSQLALLGTSNSVPASRKITKADQLAVMMLAMDSGCDLVEEKASELGESYVVDEVLAKHLRRIKEADSEEAERIELLLCLAKYGVALQTEVSC